MKIKHSTIVHSIIILLFILGSPVLAADNLFVPKTTPSSASYSRDPFRQMVNPALCDYMTGSGFAYYYNTYDHEENGNHFFHLGLPFISLVYNYYDQLYSDNTDVQYKTAVHYFNFAKAFNIYDAFSFGLSYSFTSSDRDEFDDYSSWNFGFTWRPYRYASFAYFIRDSWASVDNETIDQIHGFSLGLRPFTEKITLTADATINRNEKMSDFSNWNLRYGLELRVYNDITLTASIDQKNNMLFGASIPVFVRSNPGGTIRFNGNRAHFEKHSTNMSGYGFSIPVSNYKKGTILAEKKNMLLITFDREMQETSVTRLFEEEKIIFYDIIRAIQTATNDKSIDTICLEIETVSLGFSQLQEISSALKLFRSKGKKVYAIMHSSGNKEYFLAVTADKIYFTPNETFQLTGLSAEIYFFKGLMDKAGIKFESVKKGTYKSFDEPFTRKEMSGPYRENMKQLLSDLNSQFINHISTARNLSNKTVRAFLNKGTMTPGEALQNRLIDTVAYKEEAFDSISKSLSYVTINNYLTEHEIDYRWGIKPTIAIVNVNGSIILGSAKPTSYNRIISNEEYEKILKRAFSNPYIQAIIIRIDSGGGSASASDYMWKSLMNLKKQYKKPVVISFGNIAASGGYYIACSGDRIYASQGTITGSIGVVYGKLSLQELYAKLGINKEVIKMDRFADIFSESRDLTEQERTEIQKSINFTYDRFINKVKTARKIKTEDISLVAEGRVFTGKQAKNNKLVDSTGGLIAAIAYAKSLAGINEKCTVINMPEYTDSLFNLFESDESRFISQMVKPFLKTFKIIQYRNERVLFLIPYRIIIK